jgi:hypothetical protein
MLTQVTPATDSRLNRASGQCPRPDGLGELRHTDSDERVTIDLDHPRPEQDHRSRDGTRPLLRLALACGDRDGDSDPHDHYPESSSKSEADLLANPGLCCAWPPQTAVLAYKQEEPNFAKRGALTR